MPKIKDIVCGEMVAVKANRFTSRYKRQTYYFCSLRCKSAFERDPGKQILATLNKLAYFK